jgi:DNA-binding response OmpR family regulator
MTRIRSMASETGSTQEIEYQAPTGKLRIAVYSDDATVREAISKALGKRVSAAHPEHEVLYFATGVALKDFARGKRAADLYILDGEAVPEGGMGIARQLKDEIFNCPPTMVITGRVQDAWLAGWSGADAVVTHPIDPFTLAKSVAQVLG